MKEVLCTKGLTKKFGFLTAVKDVNLIIYQGTVMGIVGPNGSGKSTLFNLLSGYFIPTKGKIYYEGKDITSLNPETRVLSGISRNFQLVSIFPKLKVYENLVLPVMRMRLKEKKEMGIKFYFSNVSKKNFLDECLQYLEIVNMQDKVKNITGELSYGYQRLLEIAMSLALKPKILLLDEPFSGLSDAEINFVLELLQKIRKDLTIVIIEHKISKLMGFIDYLCVLNQGELIKEGNPHEVLNDPLVKKCYWGEIK